MTEESANWQTIATALKLILHKYDLDLTAVGQSQRLEYEDFEKIFYHLFLIIDQSETRRKFWSIYPARNQEEKSRFLENAVQFLNNKPLNIGRVSISQLRICGGEPFRRLITSLIKRASELEICHQDRKLFNDGLQVNTSTSNSDFTSQNNSDEPHTLGLTRCAVEENLMELEILKEEFNHLQEESANIEVETASTWKKVIVDLNQEDRFSDLNAVNMKQVLKILMDGLESCNAQHKAAEQKIREIEIPADISCTSESSLTRQNTPKRMSCLVREMREKLTMTPNNPAAMCKEKSLAMILRDLLDYDDRMSELISTLEEKQEKADEALLENPEMLERYRYFENLVPYIAFRKITV